jgi:hypothetical protein
VRVHVRGSEELAETCEHFLFYVSRGIALQKLCHSDLPPKRTGASLIEAYQEAERWLEIRSSIRNGEASYLIAIRIGTTVGLRDFGIVAPPGSAAHGHDDDDKLLMLICDIELMKRGKIMIRWRTSLVGLHLIEALPNHRRNSGLDLWKVPVWLDLLDREVGAPRRHIPGGEYQLPREIVESGAEIVYHVSGDRAVIVVDHWDVIKPEDVLPGLLVALVDDGLAARSDDRVRSRFQLSQMGLGPADLDFYAAQISSHVLRRL